MKCGREPEPGIEKKLGIKTKPITKTKEAAI